MNITIMRAHNCSVAPVGTPDSNWTDWLKERGAVISERGAHHFTHGSRHAVMSSHPAAVVPLLHLSLLEFSGPDAATFLQGQLTNDVVAIVASRFQAGAYCDAKGRVLANFLLVAQGQSYTMILSANLADEMCTRLQKYVMRMKVHIHRENLVLLGLVGDGATEVARAIWGPQAGLLEGGVAMVGTARLVRISARRILITQPVPDAKKTWDALASVVEPAGRDTWQVEQIEEAYPLVTRATQGLFLPQVLGLDRSAAVSFSKGCFPGQEIIARARYLGEVKRRLWKGTASLSAAPSEGETVFAGLTGPDSAGVVINASLRADGGCSLLAVVKDPEEPGLALYLAGPDDTRVAFDGQAVSGGV